MTIMHYQSVARNHVRRLPCAYVGLCILLCFQSSFASDSLQIGSQVYEEKCAHCHGARGEGVKGQYTGQLSGDLSVEELSNLISETMPQDNPGTCTGDEALQVATYIYKSFYSFHSENRKRRIEYSRLTVTQYKNAVADVVGSFLPNSPWPQERGLTATYSNKGRKTQQVVTVERTDPQVSFDFGNASPIPDKFSPTEFEISWVGSIYAPNTGDYEFIIEAKNGTRLFVNDYQIPIIDEPVVSEETKGWRKTLHLLGGRWYPLKICLTKVELDKVSSIRFKWVPPLGAEEVVPSRCLAPCESPRVLVVKAPFPPDERIEGYERGTTVSPEWAAATTAAALEVADHVTRLLDLYLSPGDEQLRERAKRFCNTFVERAFRRPLSDREKIFFVDSHFERELPIEESTKRVIILALKSPRFLSRETPSDGWNAFDTANWLSFALWDSVPDTSLLVAAGKGDLHSEVQIRAQVSRMLRDPRARTKLRSFLHAWLGVDRIPANKTKDLTKFPDYNRHILADLRTSLDLTLDDAVWSSDRHSDFRRMILDAPVFLNDRLADFYGMNLEQGGVFEPIPLDIERRPGVLTHPLLMLGLAHEDQSSPIHRGVMLARNIFGRTLNPPPNAVALDSPDLHPDLTTRERVAAQTAPNACWSCHRVINPLGFSLEHFDAVGRIRLQEKGVDIDVSGGYIAKSGDKTTFTGARELAQFIATSAEVHNAFVQQLFRYTTKQPVQAFNNLAESLTTRFSENEFSMQAAFADVASESAIFLNGQLSDAKKDVLSQTELAGN